MANRTIMPELSMTTHFLHKIDEQSSRSLARTSAPVSHFIVKKTHNVKNIS